MLMGKRVLAAGVADVPPIACGSAAKRRAFAPSRGPLKTCWASGISLGDARVLMARKWARARRLMDIAEAGRMVAFVVGGPSLGTTGDTIVMDGGLHDVA
jgi:enoyl-[acyl-carrier protein] reductase I